MIRRAVCGAFGAILISSAALAEPIEERAELAKVLAQQGVRGTFVLLDASTGRAVGVDAERAGRGFVPASTFKIANTLTALETGAVADENEVVPYGGLRQKVRAWEQDMNLRDSLKASNLPVHQEIARRVGVERMQAMLDRLEYGNRTLGDVIDRFWLDGPLEISALEQVRFVARLALGRLPLSERSQAITRDLLRLEKKGDAVLYGKTGWEDTQTPQLGWWVGWVERGETVHAFALNIDMKSEKDAPRRETIGRALLARLGVY